MIEGEVTGTLIKEFTTFKKTMSMGLYFEFDFSWKHPQIPDDGTIRQVKMLTFLI